MVCPFCGHNSKVTNSRARAKATQTWRRRQCMTCRKIWSTKEAIDLSTTHRVVTRHNTLEPFSRDVLFVSIKDSLAHRKSSLSDATALTDTILSGILTQNRADLPHALLFDLTKSVLDKFDPVAAAVYAAKHK